MNEGKAKSTRVLAVAPTKRGFGYFIIEGQDKILAFGCSRAKGKGKNPQVVSQVGRLAGRWLPDILALQDVQAEGSRRAPRIKELHKQLRRFAESRGIEVVQCPGRR